MPRREHGDAHLIGSFSNETCSEDTDTDYDGLRFAGAHFAGYRDHDVELTTFDDRISSLKVS